MTDTLVIVESPAKAKTIAKYLGKGYQVKASVGHVVDLPRKDLGVDLAHDFAPTYEVMPEKKKVVAELIKAAKGVKEIILAPDPDREGEAIAWHIADLLGGKDKQIRRMLINEITKTGVQQALASAGELNRDLFDAQQARRILDRLVGYKISPLFRKVRRGLSAGRVQSVAVRLVVDRENAIRAFKQQEYWSIAAQLSAKLPPEFKARLVAIDGKALELPERFDREKNIYIPLDKQKNTHIPNEAVASSILEAISNRPFVIEEVNRGERKRNPPPPFITSTLQQDAARKLGLSAKRIMTLAQRLYEGIEIGDEGAVGLITYMRTDSPRVANQALEMVREFIAKTYGKEFLPSQPRFYKSKKSAQDAHEAIRPTSLDRTPNQVKQWLDQDAYRLYELIFLRFVASQMENAVYDQTTVEIPVEKYLFRANGRVIKFKGFLAAYKETTDEEPENEEDFPLPPLEPGDQLQVREISPEQHFTKPPPRFTEASLVKELEERGIGRPSTYASILSTIQDREYVNKDQGRRFCPTPIGEMITAIMMKSFPDIMDYRFTAQMEADLDQVEEGRLSWQKLLHQFYPPFAKQLEHAAEVFKTDLSCPKCGKELVIKWGKNGEFLGCSGYPKCDYTSEFVREEGNGVKPVNKTEATSIVCPACGKPMQVKQSKRGEFLGCSGYPECKQTMGFIRGEQGEIKPRPKAAPAPAAEGEAPCEKCGKPMVVRQGKWGPFISCSGYPKCKNIRRKGKTAEGEDAEMKAPPAPVEKKAARPKAAPAPAAEDEAPCELCGKPMVIRQGKWGPFLSCSGYPKCKNIRKLPKEKKAELAQAAEEPGSEKPARAKAPAEPAPTGEPPCELCGKPMVIRQGKWGPFLGCSGYPKCKNIRKKSLA